MIDAMATHWFGFWPLSAGFLSDQQRGVISDSMGTVASCKHAIWVAASDLCAIVLSNPLTEHCARQWLLVWAPFRVVGRCGIAVELSTDMDDGRQVLQVRAFRT